MLVRGCRLVKVLFSTVSTRSIIITLMLFSLYVALLLAFFYNVKLRALEPVITSRQVTPTTQTNVTTIIQPARIIYNRVGKCGSRYLLNMMSNVAEGNGFRLVDYTDDRILDSRKRKLSMSEQMQFITYIDKQLAPPFIFHGHFHFVDFAKFGVAKPVYINLIRDPLERFISAYYYSRFGDGRNRSWSFKGTEKQKNMSLDDCVLKNHSECFTPNKLLYIIPYFCGQPSGCRVYWERSLAQAIENVKINYLVVGVLEDVHNFIKVLEALLPHFFKGTYQLSTAEIGIKRSTKTRYKTVISPQARKILKSRLHLEYKFYNFVKLKFDQLKDRIQLNNQYQALI